MPFMKWLYFLSFLNIVAASIIVSSNVRFHDCLSPRIKESGTDYFLATAARASLEDETLHIYVTGNVTNNGTFTDVDTATNTYTTLKIMPQIASYPVHVDPSAERFCSTLQGQADCPFQAGTFSTSYYVSNSYQGVTFLTTLYILNGNSSVVGCVAVETTPVLADYVWYVVVFVIVGIFVLMIVAYGLTVLFNPWTGTLNLYHGFSNYGNDPHALRLLTPGPLEFLQYLQFMVLSSALSLEFPGFFQAALATCSWACLQFRFSPVFSYAPEYSSDLYENMNSYGLVELLRITSLGDLEKAWPSFITWFLIVYCVLFGALIVCSIPVLSLRFMRREITSEGMKRNLFPFLGGITVRYVFIAFGLPLMTMCMFQLFVASHHSILAQSVISTAFSAIIITLWLAGIAYISYRIAIVKPRHDLFDSLPTILLVGPLYNVFLEKKALFFNADVILLIMRAIAFGAAQGSGVAQIVLLCFSELGYLFVLIWQRPYSSVTNMNLLSTIMCINRFVQFILMIPFISSLNINFGARSWLAYVLLLMHAVAILYFLLNAVQTIIEVCMRKATKNASTGKDLQMKEYDPYGSQHELIEQEPSSLMYYRKPRTIKYERLFTGGNLASQNSPAEEPLIDEQGDELDTLGKRNTADYSRREADIYFTRGGGRGSGRGRGVVSEGTASEDSELMQTLSSYDGPFSEEEDNDMNHIRTKRIAPALPEPVLASQANKRGTSNTGRKLKFMDRLLRVAHKQPEEKGFQVMRRGPLTVNSLSVSSKQQSEHGPPDDDDSSDFDYEHVHYPDHGNELHSTFSKDHSRKESKESESTAGDDTLTHTRMDSQATTGTLQVASGDNRQSSVYRPKSQVSQDFTFL